MSKRTLLFAGILLILTISLADVALAWPIYNLTVDKHFEEVFTYWGQSDWGLPGCEWYWYEGTMVHMTVYEWDWLDWNGLGVHQGQKPFGWGQAPYVFDPLPEADWDAINFAWSGRIDGAFGTWQANLGVDLWWDVVYEGQTEVAEMNIWFYQNGLLSVGVGQRGLEGRKDGGHKWQRMYYHRSQMLEDAWTTISVEVKPELAWFKDNTKEAHYKYGEWYLRDIDSWLEIWAGPAGGNSNYDIDYLNLVYWDS